MTNPITFAGFTGRLREFIRAQSPANKAVEASVEADTEAEFNSLAQQLFALQSTHILPYRKLCESRRISPESMRDYRQIPALPTTAFKDFELTSLSLNERTTVFYSSGTTEQRRSQHFHNAESLSLYEASLLPWFERHLITGLSRPDFFILTPPPEAAPHSSLVHMFGLVREKFASANSSFLASADADGSWNLSLTKTQALLQQAINSNHPIVLLGTAFSFVHLFDFLAEHDVTLNLPAGSRVLETGGYKGRSRTLPKAELHRLITHHLGVPSANIICEYGMSELSSQAYDGVASLKPVMSDSLNQSARVFHFPPWARAQIISPETGREVAEGETGLIRILDLANVYSIAAVQTEDLGIKRGHGFELLGRAALAEPRGCSLMAV